MSAEYERVRGLARQLNDSMPANHPCRTGGGECCRQRSIAVTPGDWKIIAEAREAMLISQQTLDLAVENALNRDRPYCPFFNGGKCTIYSFRPLACMFYGVSGKVGNPRKLEKVKKVQKRTGIDPGIPYRELDTKSACVSCKTNLCKSNPRVPLSALEDWAEVRTYIEECGIAGKGVSVDAVPLLLKLDKKEIERLFSLKE